MLEAVIFVVSFVGAFALTVLLLIAWDRWSR